MRFIENGADIPDELLLAYDEGQVIFFCGSGVSKAGANLPDFYELAKNVRDDLGVAADSEVGRLYKKVKVAEEQPRVKSVSSPDRIFSRLSRQFDRRVISNAVASSLKVGPGQSELWAHKTLLKLARGQNSPLRLITTNFDRLFEAADPKLKSRTRANLPQVPHDEGEWGIVHLHGQVNEDSSAAGPDGLVLSSADFGYAYLVQGWAREFMLYVIKQYITVFVGYSADDPPISYLLEGLNEAGGFGRPMFAFQDGADGDAIASWGEKRVTAIPYSPCDSHAALWNTLDAWSERASDPAKWRTSVFRRASRGPDKMKPFEREMIAHIVSNLKGSAALKNHEPPLPAAWLCVFDKNIRFSRKLYGLYSLDSDPPPPIGENEKDQNGKTPADAWDAFDLTENDRSSMHKDRVSSFHGCYASKPAELPERLLNIRSWLTKVAGQPAAVWWAARQPVLHHLVCWAISEELLQRGDGEKISPVIQEAWQDVFSLYRDYDPHCDLEICFSLKESIRQTGWTPEIVNRYARIFAPRLQHRGYSQFGCVKQDERTNLIEPLKASDFGRSIIPPTKLKGLQKHHLIRLEVKYPALIADIDSDLSENENQLAAVVNVQRRNIELAIDYEREHRGYRYLTVCHIELEEGEGHGDTVPCPDLSDYVLHFLRLFERLLKFDPDLAKVEYKCWRENDPIFKRLRVWVAGRSVLASSDEFADEVINIDRDLFWRRNFQRYLLLVLDRRWAELASEKKKIIEEKLKQGRKKIAYLRESKDEYEKYSAYAILERLCWLRDQGCQFTFDFAAFVAKLKQKAGDWSESYAQGAVESMSGQAVWVETDTSWDEFRPIPVHQLAEKVQSTPRWKGMDMEIERKPFVGICKDAPVKAISALSAAARNGIYATDLWHQFLDCDRERKDKNTRLRKLVAGRLVQLPHQVLQKILLTVTRWFKQHGPDIRDKDKGCFLKLWSACIEVLEKEANEARYAVTSQGKVVDWMIEAMNAPAGDLADLASTDPLIHGLEQGQGLPKEWTGYVRQLVELPAPSRQCALAIFSQNLTLFYAIDSPFASETFLSLMETDIENDDIDAVWTGFLYAARYPGDDLFKRIKPHLIEMAIRESPKVRHEITLHGLLLLLAGWSFKSETGRPVSDAELREVLLNSREGFRCRVLQRLSLKPTQLVEFFEKVWPKQKAVRSAKISAELFNLAFSKAEEEHFPELVAAMLPHMNQVNNEHLLLPAMYPESAMRKYPEKVLALLFAALPGESAFWPRRYKTEIQPDADSGRSYDVRQMLTELEKQKPELSRNPKMIELKSRLSRH